MDTRVIKPSAMGGSAPQPRDAAKPFDFVRVLKRRRVLILATIFLVTGLTGLAVLLIPPVYSATATLMVDQDDEPQIRRSDDISSIREQELKRRAKIETLIELLQSRALAQLVSRDLALHDDPEFNRAAYVGDNASPGLWKRMSSAFDRQPDPPRRKPSSAADKQAKPPTPELLKPVIDRLVNRIDVAQDGQSNLVNVTARSHSPEKAQRIANKLVTLYIKTQIEQKRATNRRQVVALDARVKELRETLLKQSAAVESFKRSNQIDKGMGQDSGAVQMGRVASELAAARAASAEAYARSGTGGGTSGNSALLTELRSQQATLERRSAELSTLYGRGHPDVQIVTAQLDQVRRDIGAETSRVGASLRSEAAAQSARVGQMSGDLGALQSRSYSQNQAGVRLGDLERDAETTGTLYVALLSRLKELRRQDAEFSADASLSSQALRPTAPSFPQPRKMMGAALAGSVVLALLLSVVVELMDHRVRTAEHIETLVGLHTLGLIPELVGLDDGAKAYLHLLEHPCSSFAETIRGSLIELTRLRLPGQAQTLLVTSALPGEGKSTVSMSLAAAAAAVGQRAVVIDFDLRRPGISRSLDYREPGQDLPAYLAGEVSVDDLLWADPAVPSLWFIRVDEAARNPGALLASPRVATLMAELSQRFDLIIVDTPPVLPVSDARSLAAHCDEALLVVRWGKSPPDAVRSAVEKFGNQFSAAILNRVDYARHAQLAYGDALEHYSRYASYYADETPARRNWLQRKRRTRSSSKAGQSREMASASP